MTFLCAQKERTSDYQALARNKSTLNLRLYSKFFVDRPNIPQASARRRARAYYPVQYHKFPSQSHDQRVCPPRRDCRALSAAFCRACSFRFISHVTPQNFISTDKFLEHMAGLVATIYPPASSQLPEPPSQYAAPIFVPCCVSNN